MPSQNFTMQNQHNTRMNSVQSIFNVSEERNDKEFGPPVGRENNRLWNKCVRYDVVELCKRQLK